MSRFHFLMLVGERSFEHGSDSQINNLGSSTVWRPASGLGCSPHCVNHAFFLQSFKRATGQHFQKQTVPLHIFIYTSSSLQGAHASEKLIEAELHFTQGARN